MRTCILKFFATVIALTSMITASLSAEVSEELRACAAQLQFFDVTYPFFSHAITSEMKNSDFSSIVRGYKLSAPISQEERARRSSHEHQDLSLEDIFDENIAAELRSDNPNVVRTTYLTQLQQTLQEAANTLTTPQNIAACAHHDTEFLHILRLVKRFDELLGQEETQLKSTDPNYTPLQSVWARLPKPYTKIAEIKTGVLRATLDLPCCSDDGSRIVVSTHAQQVCVFIYTPNGYKKTQVIDINLPYTLIDLTIDAQARTLAIETYDRSSSPLLLYLELYTFDKDQEKFIKIKSKTMRVDSPPSPTVYLSNDGTHCAIRIKNGVILLQKTPERGDYIATQELSFDTSQPKCLAWSADNSHLAIGFDHGAFEIFSKDNEQNEFIRTQRSNESPKDTSIKTLCFSPDNHFLFFCTNEYIGIFTYDAPTNQFVRHKKLIDQNKKSILSVACTDYNSLKMLLGNPKTDFLESKDYNLRDNKTVATYTIPLPWPWESLQLRHNGNYLIVTNGKDIILYRNIGSEILFAAYAALDLRTPA